MIKKSDKYAWMPTVRYPETSWKNFAALVYAIVADLLGLRWMMMLGSGSNYFDIIKLFVPAIFFSCHGRIVASYLVQEACHGNIFVEQWANKSLGTICLWFAGCPYANFDHVRFMHDAHHKDRADSVEFDYRDFVNQQHVAIRTLILNLEWYFVPVTGY